jgi:hypothetical protein
MSEITWFWAMMLSLWSFCGFCVILMLSTERHERRIALAASTAGFLSVFSLLMVLTQ